MQGSAITGARRSCAFALACCFLTLVIGSKSSAQVLYGSIVGTVTDPSSALVPNVNIKATNTATGLVRETITDSAGYYSLPNLPEGAYDLSFSGRGFRTITQTSVTVRINNVTRSDASLQVGAVSEVVNVEASAALLQTTRADVNTSISTKAIEDLPLSGYRNYACACPRLDRAHSSPATKAANVAAR